jgi:ribose 5-phosphate isomerase B
MKIGIAADHGGYQKKEKIKKFLKKKGYEVIDYGAESFDMGDDYPKYAFKLGEDINNISFGILLCCSGIGMSIAANKVKNIRCAKVSTLFEAKCSRLDNDANVIALAGRMSSFKLERLIKAFIKTNFSKEERHIRRIKMVDNYGNHI